MYFNFFSACRNIARLKKFLCTYTMKGLLILQPCNPHWTDNLPVTAKFLWEQDAPRELPVSFMVWQKNQAMPNVFCTKNMALLMLCLSSYIGQTAALGGLFWIKFPTTNIQSSRFSTCRSTYQLLSRFLVPKLTNKLLRPLVQWLAQYSKSGTAGYPDQ